MNSMMGTTMTPQHGAELVGDVRFSLAKIDKIKDELNYDPTVSFEDGLRHTIDWYRTGGTGR